MNSRLEKVFKLPLYQRLIIFSVILILAGGGLIWTFIMPSLEELKQVENRNEELEVKVQQDQRIANNLPRFKDEYEKLNQQLEKALTELPNEKEIPTLLTNVSSLAKDNGLEVLRFKPGGEVPKGFYAEVPVSLKLNGSYHQVALFFQDVGYLSRIVNIGNVTIKPGNRKGSGNILDVECLATTYRFLGDTSGSQPIQRGKGSKK